ncbi:MAG: hypothetical protein GY788_27110 [bacterium]|nr:hypothetical protein [bacterium]
MWVNTETGEADHATAEAKPEGPWLWIEEEELADEPDREPFDDAWVPSWLTQQYLHLDADEGAIKEQTKRLLASVKARRKYLDWACTKRAEAIVKGDLEAKGGKRKSIDYPYGRCGFRSNKRVVVHDEQVVLAWAAFYCTDAIKVSEKLVTGPLPKDQDVPGVQRVEEEVFFVRPAKPKPKPKP